nr:hypothetical protein [Kibdelosporangium sp. MJ126-NF4]CTQ97510.1 hypothetical protein [Kibdelosporangium sp. MJ126-NF4]
MPVAAGAHVEGHVHEASSALTVPHHFLHNYSQSSMLCRQMAASIESAP